MDTAARYFGLYDGADAVVEADVADGEEEVTK